MRYAAFLRAINVGGRNVKMEQLRRIFESVGLTNVETVIASGNVIFDSRSKNSKAIEKKLQAKLEESLGYTVATFVRSMEELSAIASHTPFPKIPKTASLLHRIRRGSARFSNPKITLGAKQDRQVFVSRSRDLLALSDAVQ